MYELDERELVISSEAIHIGAKEFLLDNISKVALYIHSYNGFRYQQMWNPESSYGMDNKIYFEESGNIHEYRFLIADERAFVALYWVLDDWTHSGYSFGLKEVYGRRYIDQIVNKNTP